MASEAAQPAFVSVVEIRRLRFVIIRRHSALASTPPTLPAPRSRYTDPWVTITPTGDVYVSSLSFNPVGPVPGDIALSVSTDGGLT